jgi:hypothetical protein
MFYNNDIFIDKLFYAQYQTLIDIINLEWEGISPIISYFLLLRIYKQNYLESNNLLR